MPSLPFKSKKKDKEVADAAVGNTTTTGEKTPPPAYNDASRNDGGITSPPAFTADTGVDITAAFSTLNLHATPTHPDVNTCLAHLKLLFAIQSMKEDVGYTDGLWNIWDSLADGSPDLSGFQAQDAPLPEELDGQKRTTEDYRKIKLSKIREKRWAVFVARAVDRYEAWWSTFPKNMLHEDDMVEGSGALYHRFVEEKGYIAWSETNLPPLDVIMIWHAHMLNPRSFLEDTIRCGMSSFWATGLPWNTISSAIDTDFNYNVSDETKTNWAAMTGRNWVNAEDTMTKSLKCPACHVPTEVPWTTCGIGEAAKGTSTPDLVGNGYGDGQFLYPCPTCGTKVDKKLLSVAKFIKDAQSLIMISIPMPGTILDPIKGMPKAIVTSRSYASVEPRTFPNRLIRRKLAIQITELIQRGMPLTPTMDTLRLIIEKLINDPVALREIEGVPPLGRFRIPVIAKICVRKMMSRYWENFSPFALDLVGAVMRQGIFTAKMYQIDWLHSPACRETMARLITKYERFIGIMQGNPTKTCVPTLDVDLAWHTHQLSPSAYYKYTTDSTLHTRKFIDHDDKIDEEKLSKSFEWTMRKYQEMYSEVYSECTCWYCETIRSSNTGSVSRILGVSNQDRAAQNFHDSGRAKMCPPDKSAHISAHNAVRPQSTTTQDRVANYARERQRLQLELNYQKACKRAQKKGRNLPPRDEYYDHWGYQYYMYSPFIYPLYFTPGLYYGWDPGYVSMGSGAWASCAAGSCAGSVAAGGCGGPGGCGATGAGGSNGACGGGGCSGGGGGCGGGGGGCGGGGGGGGGGCGGG